MNKYFIPVEILQIKEITSNIFFDGKSKIVATRALVDCLIVNDISLLIFRTGLNFIRFIGFGLFLPDLSVCRILDVNPDFGGSIFPVGFDRNLKKKKKKF